MGYRSLAECVRDLEATGQLVVIDQEVDPYLEVAADPAPGLSGGGPCPALPDAKGTAFPLLGNLFGTLDRTKYLFRDALESVRQAGRAEGRSRRARQESLAISRRARRFLATAAPAGAVRADPGPPDHDRPTAADPVLADGRRPFITLPQVYTEDPTGPAWRGRTWGCTGSSSPATSTSRTARSGCTTRSTAASACTTRRRSVGASRCG